MINGKKITVVMPAYNAARTLRRTYDEIPAGVVDQVILTDDGSTDDTLAVARSMGITVIVHDRNRGYGANQKTCYAAALADGADVVVMLHPDYQYSPRLIPDMAGPIARGERDIMLGSRMRGREALAGGMPLYKFAGNRLLTAWQNLCLGQSFSEYHTGYRAFGRRVLETLPFTAYADDFLFDCQILTDGLSAGFRAGEIHCPARYEADSSSIGLGHSLKYGFGVLRISAASGWRRLIDL